MPRPLTQAEKATNAETQEHILEVARRLNEIATMLIHRWTAHDCSKLEDPELETFVRMTPKLKGSTYGSEQYKVFLAEMKPALDHHYAQNRHHPEHFPDGVDGMNLVDLVEMLCDWKAATARHADGDIERSLEVNMDRFGLSPQLVSILGNTIRDLDWQKK
jgi:hypothetical protein